MLKINITTDSKQVILEHIQKYLNNWEKNTAKSGAKSAKSFVIVTPNPEQVVLAHHDSHFAQILNRADVALPDGIGLVIASRILGRPIVQKRISGVELMQEIVTLAAKEGVTIGLIGGKAGLAVETLECLKEKTSNLLGWAEDAPTFLVQNHTLSLADRAETTSTYFDRLASAVREHRVGILFVGLGAPKQEYFIEQLERRCHMMLMSVGGSFDLISGRIKHAPLLIRSIGFEWAWRLIQEPWRWRRQMALVDFMRLVWKQRFIRG
jgi:N-acetylglucosaminyldiphosphoundecaprenol N-acetyl-beta-D-mannosaminyltransferase